MSEQYWTATLICADCGAVLNTAEHVPESKKAWVAFTSGGAAGPCPNGCRSTFSDMNWNTKLEWHAEHVEPYQRIGQDNG